MAERDINENSDNKKYKLLYSPRTKFTHELEAEDKLFSDLTLSFDPITIKIIKKHYKERLGILGKEEFAGILKNHLFSWHPELENRETQLIKLLARLYDEIDLNVTGNLEWDEFTNYIIHSSKNNEVDISKYEMKTYNISKKEIDPSYLPNVISHSFYIEKHNIIGLVQEGRSHIDFFDGTTYSKLKTVIEINDTQKDIDQLENKELDIKANDLLMQEEELRKKKKLMAEQNKHILRNKLNQHQRQKSVQTGIKNTYFPHHDNYKKRKDLINTPEKLKRELYKIKNPFKVEDKCIQHNERLTIIATLFINEYDLLLVSSTNNKISAWKYLNGLFKNINSQESNIQFDKERNFLSCAILASDIPQYTMTWDPYQKALYTGQADGKILKWELDKSRNIGCDTLDIIKAMKIRKKKMNKYSSTNTLDDFEHMEKSNHNINVGSSQMRLDLEIKLKGIIKTDYQKRNSVSCVITLNKLQLIAAGYFNGHIILWDPLFKEYRKYYTDQETGIYQIAFDSNKNYLFSCGFDHHIHIYDPYIDCNSIYKLTGYNGSIISVDVNEKESQLISLDIFGNIKLWDTNNFFNYQTINLTNNTHNTAQQENLVKSKESNNIEKKKKSSNLKLLLLTKTKRMIISGQNLAYYESQKVLNDEFTDDLAIFGAYYNKRAMEIVTICLRKIILWSVLNGKITRIFNNPMKAEISAFDIDSGKKIITLGDVNGKVKNFNMITGDFIKEFESHNREISFIQVNKKLKLVISCSNDYIIKIHTDSELLHTKVLKEVTIEFQIKSMILLETTKRISLGMSNGTIRFYNLEHFRLDPDFEEKDKNSIESDSVFCLLGIQGTELIFYSRESGRSGFMIIPPCLYKYCFISSIMNENTKPDSQEKIGTAIQSASIDFEQKLLFTGDILGYLKCYDISGILNECLNKKITEDIFERLQKKEVKELWSTRAHKETIRYLSIHKEICPAIILTTSTDLKVRLCSLDNKGELLEELRQNNAHYLTQPIGIEYNFIDYFNANPHLVGLTYKETLLREDLVNFQYKRLRKNEYQQAQDYAKQVTEYNAKEILYQLTKGSVLKPNQSNKWNYDISLSFIRKQNEIHFDKLHNIIKQNQKEISKSEIQMQHTSIYSHDYKPNFLNGISAEKSNDLMNIISTKMKMVMISLSKATLNQKKYEKYIKEQEKINKRIMPIKKKTMVASPILHMLSFENERNSKSNVLSSLIQKKTNCTNDQFAKCKENFEKKFEELVIPIHYLTKSNPSIKLPKIKVNHSCYN